MTLDPFKYNSAPLWFSICAAFLHSDCLHTFLNTYNHLGDIVWDAFPS